MQFLAISIPGKLLHMPLETKRKIGVVFCARTFGLYCGRPNLPAKSGRRATLLVSSLLEHATPANDVLGRVLLKRSSHSPPTPVQQIIDRIAMHVRLRPLKLDSSVYLKFSSTELSAFCSSYYLLNPEEKLSLMLALAETDTAMAAKLARELKSAVTVFEQTAHGSEVGERSPRSMLSFRQKLQDVLTPAYRQLCLELGRLPNGVKLIVRMRADVLEIIASGDLSSNERSYQNLKQLEAVLKDILAHWFSTGLLDVKRVTWQASPSAMLERIAAGEVVHPMKNWLDLKKRVESQDRLCFAFCHPSLGDSEPIVSLFCALCHDVPRSVGQVIESRASSRQDFSSYNNDDAKMNGCNTPENALPSCAVFYSINALQPGLKGIELGSHLIKAVVRSLRHDMPQYTTFVTLSPIPGFRSWLLHQLNVSIAGQTPRPIPIKSIFLDTESVRSITDAAQRDAESSPMRLKEPVDILKYAREILRNNSWFLSSPNLRTALRKPLLLAAEHYLLREKHRTFALCPVAHFHLSNGAELLQLNYLADTTPKRLNQSFGIMTNYHYVIAKPSADNRYSHAERILEQNSANYLQNCVIAVDERFRENSFGETA